MAYNNHISINYSDEKLRILVEEYIAQQKSSFLLKGICSYVLYWAKEDGHTTKTGLFESDMLSKADCDRISKILERIVEEGRIVKSAKSDGTIYIK